MNTDQIIERIIEQEIYCNASTFVADLQATELVDQLPDTFEKILECSAGPDYSEAPDGYRLTGGSCVLNGAKETFYGFDNSETDSIGEGYHSEAEALRAAWGDSGDEPPRIEALQHWLVSDWLADKLEQVGALVTQDLMGFNVWGRTECGQSLTMDSDLHKVAALIK